jgi:hypothetical protein
VCVSDLNDAYGRDLLANHAALRIRRHRIVIGLEKQAVRMGKIHRELAIPVTRQCMATGGWKMGQVRQRISGTQFGQALRQLPSDVFAVGLLHFPYGRTGFLKLAFSKDYTHGLT